MNKSFDYVIVGAGLSGCVIANRLASKGKKILILEKRNHIGGNVYDEIDSKTNIIVQKYGPHIFHTNNETVWNYVKDLCEWIPFEMKCGVDIDGFCSPSPFNFSTIDHFFKNDAAKIKKDLLKEYPGRETVTIVELLNSKNDLIRKYATFLFEKDYSLYTAKQWGISPEKVDINVLKRVPVRLDYREKYFTDKYQFMPKKGFTSLIRNMIKDDNITIQTSFDAINVLKITSDALIVDYEGCNHASIIWTGPIDRLFNYKYGLLPYRSLDFEYKALNNNDYQCYPVVAYPKAPAYTRITDYNQLPPQGCSKTVIAIEYPKQYSTDSKTDPYYPINNDVNDNLYCKYLHDFKMFKNAYLLGRLALYKYYNMDQIIFDALQLADSLINKN